jgi:hypothetical protein
MVRKFWVDSQFVVHVHVCDANTASGWCEMGYENECIKKYTVWDPGLYAENCYICFDTTAFKLGQAYG